jgi:hypothetical protein
LKLAGGLLGAVLVQAGVVGELAVTVLSAEVTVSVGDQGGGVGRVGRRATAATIDG